MIMRFLFRMAVAAWAFLAWCAAALGQAQPPSDSDRQVLQQELQSLEQSLQALTEQGVQHAADAGVFRKGLAWALKYDREFPPADLALLDKAVSRGRQRAALLAEGKMPWATRRG